MIGEQKDFHQLQKKLGVEISEHLLVQAVTHTSYAHENRKHQVPNNERLEFLGDAVLELVVSESLFRQYPNLPEGELTKFRANLVCEPSLVKVAEQLELGYYLRLGKGEESSGGRQRPSILADAVEALIGAVFLEKGFETAKEIILALFGDEIVQVSNNYNRDYKTLLQEMTQDKFNEVPAYSIIDESGPDHDKRFVAQIFLNQEVVSTGHGRSKKEAEQNAAKVAFKRLKQHENL